MDEFVERLAGIGVPAVIFLIVMSTTVFAGAAAVTTALATLGSFGMVSGIRVLVLIGEASSIIAKYGYSAIITTTCKKIMEKDYLSKDEMCAKIDKYPITRGLKEKVKAKIKDC